MTNVDRFNIDSMEVIAGWIEGPSEVIYGGSKAVYLGMPTRAALVMVWSSPINLLII